MKPPEKQEARKTKNDLRISVDRETKEKGKRAVANSSTWPKIVAVLFICCGPWE